MLKKLIAIISLIFMMIIFVFLFKTGEEHEIVNVPIIKTKVITKIPKSVILKSNKTIVINKSSQTIDILISYYTNSLSDCGKTDGISASGKNLVTASRGGTYVAAPKNISFGTKINVEGIGVVQVEDRGGAIKHVWLDGKLYMKLDVFVKGATQRQIDKMGIIKTTGYIVK